MLTPVLSVQFCWEAKTVLKSSLLKTCTGNNAYKCYSRRIFPGISCFKDRADVNM